MGKPKVVEVDFYVLLEKIKLASDAKCLIEKNTQKDQWNAYVEEQGVRVTALEAFAKVKFMIGKPRLVAINMNSDWDGCYAYSVDDEAAIKYIPPA